ncbi:MAG: DUF58 domain-containing protein [Streptosporangiales bacterium]|nr:DUF58 domain-containing protein [Streptosporangiales bacterium]
MSGYPAPASERSWGNPQPTLQDLAPEAALRKLELIVTRRLDGLLNGDYPGLLPGPGTELAEARIYEPGTDDVRRMDWNVTARTTVPHVRDMVADRELETWALVDGTASMDFGTGRVEKRDLAVAAVAAVGFITARAGNRLGALVTGDHRGRGGLYRFPARAGRGPLLTLLHALLTAPRMPPGTPAGSLAEAIVAMDRSVRRRGLVVVVSDFLDGLGDAGTAFPAPAPSWERPLHRLALRHQVVAVEVYDPRELDLPDVGVLTVVDPETGRRREVATASTRLRERYAAAAAEQRATIRESLRRSGIPRLALRTDGDWLRDIVEHVEIQRRLAGAPPVAPPVADPVTGPVTGPVPGTPGGRP